jgi:hypothetical protein
MDTQEYHPLITSLQKVLHAVYGHGMQSALTLVVPLTAIMAFFVDERDTRKVFSKEFIALLNEERDRFLRTGEVDCNYLSDILLAESRRIVELEDA